MLGEKGSSTSNIKQCCASHGCCDIENNIKTLSKTAYNLKIMETFYMWDADVLFFLSSCTFMFGVK